ncbi:phosphate ABC transporter permease subunit PstC [Prosthecobacter vanneervenii]|uniref:Phosphate transport system permease protein n=1 Tax=Prosthecobacter vanneervenii TaxID=48466 RepID=A0A7W7YCL6_9BACT|nr:phosphate ABC transporter permease subunit PstC [Prosthecobacter vanneervenii]MBB5033718.1 phosphate transport system permease protein [Prosthecobacter vanneervenii]
MNSLQTPPSRPPLRSVLLRSRKHTILGLDPQKLIKYFFGSNASVAIIVLVLIMVFLMREGIDFLPTYQRELQTYRRAGLEFCDIIDQPLQRNQALSSSLRQALSASLETLSKTARDRRDAAFLLKRQVEDKTARPRESLTQALEKTPPPAADQIEVLRRELKEASTAAAKSLAYPDLFTAAEREQLKSEFATLTPESTDMPPLLQSLSTEFSTKDREARSKFAALVTAQEEFEESAEPLQEVLDELKAKALETKEKAVEFEALENNRQRLLEAAAKETDADEKASLTKEAEASVAEPVNLAESTKEITDRTAELREQVEKYAAVVEKAAAALPKEAGTEAALRLINEVRADMPAHAREMRAAAARLEGWHWDKPVSIFSVIGAFFFGTQWLTNSSWQDFFGFVPLLSGSLVIAAIAIIIATPVSVVAAIYTNQFASDREKEIIKPIIEFIQAIPSVVLGFIGISLLGNLIKDVSEWSWLQWVPGFPIQERLNMFNAGCLLAFMAVPTMFSLSEDALNNVPRAYIDASDALGATKLQTVFRVIVPAGISGILSAILLGLGRVVGETMVVLLVAGNRIAIPDFSAGPGVIFHPAHTLTGIIAQELGEVSRGSSHWQALFMVGIVLFAISLLVNWCARAVARRFEPHKA